MGPLVFVVICESAADFRLAARLAQRVICEQVEWIEEDQIDYCLSWWGRDLMTPFWSWNEIDDQARQAGVNVRGHFDQEPGGPDARIARRALFHLRNLWQDGQPIDGILLIRDDDGVSARGQGPEQARKSVPDLSARVVIGLAHLKRECWVLAGFVPRDQRETDSLADLRQELSFDPVHESHRLTAKPDHELRSAKRVLNKLTQDQYDREEACWALTPLVTLRDRGVPSGLAAFLDEVADRLVPLFGKLSA